jgi:hypothetical protein
MLTPRLNAPRTTQNCQSGTRCAMSSKVAKGVRNGGDARALVFWELITLP